MKPDDKNQNLNFNSNQPTGNGIFGSPASNTANGRPVTTLSVPVLSPTHFDDPAQVPPQVPPAQNPTSPQASAPNMTPNELEHLKLIQDAKKFKILTIVFGSLTGVFAILSLVGLIVGISTGDQLAQANADLKNKNAIVAALEETTGVKPIAKAEDVPTFRTTHGYIYLDDWNIKLKIPEDLTSVSYVYDQKYRPSVCFNGLKKGIQYFPAFADIAKNTGGMGCLVRVATSEGNSDTDGRSFGTLVFTDNKGYNYFYTEPTHVYSEDAAEQGLENTAVQIIRNMLSGNNISIYD